jgi:hypothetical protein
MKWYKPIKKMPDNEKRVRVIIQVINPTEEDFSFDYSEIIGHTHFGIWRDEDGNHIDVLFWTDEMKEINEKNHCEECGRTLENGTVFCSHDCRLHYFS